MYLCICWIIKCLTLKFNFGNCHTKTVGDVAILISYICTQAYCNSAWKITQEKQISFNVKKICLPVILVTVLFLETEWQV